MLLKNHKGEKIHLQYYTVLIKKQSHIIGPMQFKPMLFKGQHTYIPIYINTSNITQISELEISLILEILQSICSKPNFELCRKQSHHFQIPENSVGALILATSYGSEFLFLLNFIELPFLAVWQPEIEHRKSPYLPSEAK